MFSQETGIKFPTINSTTINLLDFTPLNRETKEKHVEIMSRKIKSNGFMDIIKVFPLNSKGKYIVAEGQHRVKALEKLLTEQPETQIPIAILHWIDPNDDELVSEVITSLNVGSKSWNAYDYVSKNAQSSRENNSDYKHILEKLEDKNYKISNNQVCQVYNGGNLPDDEFRDGKYWTLTPFNKKYGNIILDKVKEMMDNSNKKAFGAMKIRYFVVECYKFLKHSSQGLSDSATISQFEKFLSISSSAFSHDLNKGIPLPEGSELMSYYMKNRVLNQL